MADLEAFRAKPAALAAERLRRFSEAHAARHASEDAELEAMADVMRHAIAFGMDPSWAAIHAFPESTYPDWQLAGQIAQESAVFILHLHKCAGTSLGFALQHAVGNGRFKNSGRNTGRCLRS